jgi:nitrous oxidase accessory protein NosD
VLDNDHLGVLATGGAELTIERPLITGHTGIAVMVDGKETRLVGDDWTLTENGVALQLLDGATARTKKSTFKDNGLHVEARGKAKLIANETQFAQSRNGVGLFITAEASGEFTACAFSDEAKTAIVSDSQVTIKNSNVIGCGTCGIFFFGAADAELTANTISNNASCGVQVMADTVVLRGNTITDHTVFGVHIQPAASVEEHGNTYISNYMADVNHEQEPAT